MTTTTCPASEIVSATKIKTVTKGGKIMWKYFGQLRTGGQELLRTSSNEYLYLHLFDCTVATGKSGLSQYCSFGRKPRHNQTKPYERHHIGSMPIPTVVDCDWGLTWYEQAEQDQAERELPHVPGRAVNLINF